MNVVIRSEKKLVFMRSARLGNIALVKVFK